MVLASTAPFAAVRWAREVVEEFEGLPVEGDRLWIFKKKLLVPLKQTYSKMADEPHVFNTSPEASKSKMPVAFSEIHWRLGLLIHLHFLLKESDRREYWIRSKFKLDCDFGEENLNNITWDQWPRHPALSSNRYKL